MDATSFREGVRPGNALDHLSAVGLHLQLFMSALVAGGSPSATLNSKDRSRHARSVPAGILVPAGTLKERWDILIMILILYSAAAVPMRLAFDAEPEGALWVFEASMSVFFLADVGLAFSTAFQREDGVLVYDRGSIARHYLFGWFWIDAPSAVPVELIEYSHLLGMSEFDNLTTLRVLRMFRLFRLLRLLKVKEYVTYIEEALTPPLTPR